MNQEVTVDRSARRLPGLNATIPVGVLTEINPTRVCRWGGHADLAETLGPGGTGRSGLGWARRSFDDAGTIGHYYVCEETTDEVVLMKDRAGRVIGFERLNFADPIPEHLRVQFEAVTD